LLIGLLVAILIAAGALMMWRPPGPGGLAAGHDTVIMVVGDSLAEGLASGLWRLDPRHDRYTVINESRISSGLARREDFDWTGAIATLLRQDKPSAVVIFIGLNDARPSAAFRSARWEQDYRARIAAMLAVTESQSVSTIWVGLPVMRDAELRRHAAYLNGLYRDEVAHAKHARFIDLWRLTGGADSSYQPYLANARGRLERFREQDGIHFTAFGYDVLAQRILQELI
jgi:hypothetical protein